MNAKDIMTAAPFCCLPTTRLPEVARLMLKHDCGAIPVIDSVATGRPIGVVTDRDVCVRAVTSGRDVSTMTANDCMSGPCVVVSQDSTLVECCDTMEANQIRRLVVVDGDRRIVGVVAQADVVRAASVEKTAEVMREISLPNEALHATF